MAIHIEELKAETREKLGLPDPVENLGDRFIALGKVFKALRGLDDKDAMEVLVEAERYITQRIVPKNPDVKPSSIPPLGWAIQVVAREFSLKESLMKDRVRDAKTVLARQVAMYLLVMTNHYTLADIGKSLGGRSPATVSYGFQMIAQRITRKTALRDKVIKLQRRLTGEESQ